MEQFHAAPGVTCDEMEFRVSTINGAHHYITIGEQGDQRSTLTVRQARALRPWLDQVIPGETDANHH